MLTHLEKLKRLYPYNNINDIHEYLCGSKSNNLIKISSVITDLYEIAESEREFTEREKHSIDDATYHENADCKRSFFINPNPENPENARVELEYFLNLLYSISFTLYLARKNRQRFIEHYIKSINNNLKPKHLSCYEYYLNTLENFYIALDTLAVLIYLTCGDLNKDITSIYFNSLGKDLKSHPYAKNFNIKAFNIDRYPLDILYKMRNMRVHRPFLDWEKQDKIVSKPENLSKVKSVCDREKLFDKNIHKFIDECYEEITNILKISLGGVLKTYRQRLKDNKTIQFHETWEKFLA